MTAIAPCDRELAASVVRHLGDDPRAIREIVGLGDVNCVFVVTRASGEPWVVRFCRDPSDTSKYAEESWCLEVARRHGLPVPDLVATGELDAVPFIVQSFVEGENADSNRSPELWRTLGHYARIVNEIALDDSAPDGLFGRFGRDPRASWLAHVGYNLEQLGPDDPLIALEIYPGSARPILHACFESLREAVDRFGLTHGDLVPKNVLLPPNGSPTLIDWGSAQVGPVPFRDYLRIASDDPAERFLPADLSSFAEGYGIPPERIRTLAADINLLDRIDLVRWALDRRPDRLPEIAAKARLTVAERLGR